MHATEIFLQKKSNIRNPKGFFLLTTTFFNENYGAEHNVFKN